MNASAIVLAGGQSRRMGRDKAWLEWNGRPLLQRAVDTLRSLGIKEIFISGRPGQDYATLNCPVLHDVEPNLGPLSGMERGLSACTSPRLIVLAVDLPLMSPALLDRLLHHCDRRTGAVPVLDTGLEPLAAIYPKRCHALATAAMGRAQYSARDFASACLREGAVRPFPVPRDEIGCFVNWNRPTDVTKAACPGGSSSPNG